MATGYNVRVGDADREAVAAQLREHYADGRLTLEELNERLDQTFHWHWELHPRLRVIAGLERATALAVNPAAPEFAAEVLRRQAHRASQ